MSAIMYGRDSILLVLLLSLNLTTSGCLRPSIEPRTPPPPTRGTFWQVTDLHWDRLYTRTGDPFDDCHGVNMTQDNGEYGNMACDTGTGLYSSAVQAMAKIEPEPDFILWTGDNAPHADYPRQTWTDVYDALANASALLARHFRTGDIFPALGNHDTIPEGQFPADDEQFYANFLVNGGWDAFIGDNARETFLRGGYYSKSTSATERLGLSVIVVNTCLYLRENRLVDASTQPDPAAQFAWIERQLAAARRQRRNTIIASHVAPGYYAVSAPSARTRLHMKPAYNDRLVRLLANYSDVIVGLVFGHEHLDSFRLLSSPSPSPSPPEDNRLRDYLDDENFKVAAFIAPSVNVWIAPFLRGKNSINPGIRLYEYNATSGVIQDYYQYYLDYNEANLNASTGVKCDVVDDKRGHKYRHRLDDDDDNDNNVVVVVVEGDGDIPNRVCICNEYDDNICAEWRLLYRPTTEYNLTDLSLSSVVQLYRQLQSSSQLFDTFVRHVHLDFVVASCDDPCRHLIFCSFVNITERAMEGCFR